MSLDFVPLYVTTKQSANMQEQVMSLEYTGDCCLKLVPHNIKGCIDPDIVQLSSSAYKEK